MKHMVFIVKEGIVNSFQEVSLMVCLFMGRRSCISSEHLLNFLLHSTEHGRAAASSFVGVSQLAFLFASTSLFSNPSQFLSLFPVPGLSLPFPKSVLFSPLRALPSNLPSIWQWYSWAKQRGDTVDFTMGGKPIMFVFSGIWEIEGRKGARKATLFGIHILPLSAPVMKQQQFFWPLIIR